MQMPFFGTVKERSGQMGEMTFMRNFIDSDWGVVASPSVTRTVGEADENYLKSVEEISEFMLSVTARNLPDFAVKPQHYADYEKKLVTAKASANIFKDTVYVNLCSYPSIMKSKMGEIIDSFSGIIKEADILIGDPGNENARNAAKGFIDTLEPVIENVLKRTVDMEDSLNKYVDKITEQAQALGEISELMTKDKGVDENEVKRLKSLIDEVKKEIRSLTEEMIEAGMGDTVFFGIGMAVTVLAFPMGLFSWLLTGPVIALSSACLALDSIKLKTLNSKITETWKVVGDLNSTVAVLQEQAEAYKDLSEKSEEMKQNLSVIHNAWETLLGDARILKTEFENGEKKFESRDWVQMKNDFTEAKSKGNTICSELEKIIIQEMYTSDAVLKAGMSRSEVEMAIQNSHLRRLTDVA